MNAEAGPLYLDERIAPRRALSRRGMAWLFAGLLVWNAGVCGFLFVIGAWPVPIFLGVDVVGLAAAFAIFNRRARDGERVQVSAAAVTVSRGLGEGAVVWTAPPAWTRVLAPGAARAALQLTASGRSVTLGASLGAAEKHRFAQALQHAVSAACAERWPSASGRRLEP